MDSSQAISYLPKSSNKKKCSDFTWDLIVSGSKITTPTNLRGWRNSEVFFLILSRQKSKLSVYLSFYFLNKVLKKNQYINLFIEQKFSDNFI